jgi:hypothetical protein
MLGQVPDNKLSSAEEIKESATEQKKVFPSMTYFRGHGKNHRSPYVRDPRPTAFEVYGSQAR